MAILSAFDVFALMNHLAGGTREAFELGEVSYDNVNWLLVIVIGIIGVVAGYLYFYSHKLIHFLLKPLKKYVVLRCAVGGLALGAIGTFLPLTMFSGEEQINTIFGTGVAIGAGMLSLIGVVKILLTNICIESGLKGGHFFPMIFAGISLGYGFSLLFGLNPVIATAVMTSVFISQILQKPLATVLLLMIIFPVKLVPIMLVGAVFGAMFKAPKTAE